MSKDKKLIPELRFPEFVKDGEWEEKNVNEAASLVTDYVANGSFESLRKSVEVQDEKGYALYVRLTDLRAGLGHSEQKYVNESSYKFLSKSALWGGELLMANIGANVGEVWEMPKLEMPATLAPNMLLIKINSLNDSSFIFQFLGGERGRKNISKAISGSGHPKINKTDLKQVILMLPPSKREQQKIASCLLFLDEVISAHNQKVELLKEHKNGLMQNLFPQEDERMPKYRFPEFVKDGEWDTKTIGEIFGSFSGGTPITSEKGYYGGKIPFIRSAEINKERTELFLTEEGLKNSSAKIVNKGDLLVALYGANSGDSAISKINGAINQAILCLQSEYSNAFIRHFLTLKKDWIVSRYIQGGQGNLSGDIVKSISIPFPGKSEQQKIASFLSTLDDLITTQTDKIKQLKKHKKGLMQGLFPKLND
jgi:type I restriction enzyme S subunit